MDLLDLFVNDSDESERLRRLSRRVTRKTTSGKSSAGRRKLREDVGFLALVQLTQVRLLIEKGLITESEFVERLLNLDRMDGAADGKIDPEMLRKALGLRMGKPSKSRPQGLPVARRVEEPKKIAAARSKTAAFAGAFAGAKPGAKPRPKSKPPAPPKAEPPPQPEPEPDLTVEAVMGTEIDPESLGKISYEDYFGAGEKEE